MSVMDKLMFWKKEPDFGKDLDLGMKPDLGMGKGFDSGLGQQGYGNQGFDNSGMNNQNNLGLPSYDPALPNAAPQQNQFAPKPPSMAPPGFQASPAPQVQQSYQPQDVTSKELEIVSAKLDALKMSIDMVNQRLANLERIANRERF